MKFSKEQIEEIFNNNSKKSEICKLLNINCEGKNAIYIDNQILEYSKEIGLCTREDISSFNLKKRYNNIQIDLYNKNPKYCINCGNKIPFNKRFNSCCSQSCGSAYGNKLKGKRTEETKKKISESLVKNENLISVSKLIQQGKILNENNYPVNDKLLNENSLKEKTCVICGRKYYGIINISGNIGKGKTCSNKCHKELIINRSKETIKRVIDEGRFQGWQTRNIKSYAEKFWIKVLQNNNINYISEYYLDKKYFLDFYIVKNNVEIDLEIDGKQHKYKDRLEHDKIRDEYIKSKNIVVYRIEWNEVNSEKGSLIMKEKIDNFLEFYNKL